MNRQIVEETQKVIAGYTPTKCKRIAAELEAIWLKVTPKRTELLSREAKEKLKPQNIPNDVLIAIGNEIGKASGNKIDVFLPLIVLLWNEYGPEWRMVAASALGPMGMCNVIRNMTRKLLRIQRTAPSIRGLVENHRW